jgi:hypothetical protein
MKEWLNSEHLTLLILVSLALLACMTLGAGAKELLSNLVSGLLGYLTKSAVQAVLDKPKVMAHTEPEPPK